MIQVKKEGVILEKTDHEFENEGVFNPAAFREGDFVHLIYRAVRRGNNSTLGYCKLKHGIEIVERLSVPVFFRKMIMNLKALKTLG